MSTELFHKIELPTVTYEQPLGLFINNEFVKGAEGKTFDVINPTTEEVIASVQEATAPDVDRAVKIAREAFNGVWGKTNANQRGRLLFKLADLIERDHLILASIESLDNGKSISMAKGDVGAVAGCIRYYAGWADKLHGKVIETDSHKFNYTKVEPIGVVGQIIPWNFPLLMFAWKIGPALATGNTVVLKTAEQTPLSALYAAKLVKEAGFPPGVVNVLSGLGPVAGQAIAEHMDIDKIAFTGSTVVGRKILRAAADSNLKKVTLELGGKSPNVVFEDADIDAAIDWANYGVFYNHGQTCCAGTRIFVQETIYDKFITAFKAKTEKNAVGDPFHEKTFQGPQVSQLQFDRIMSYIDIGKKDGATLECGGGRHGEKGYFIQPTIFTNCTGDMKIMKEEIFGPVAAIAKFKDIDDLVSMANDTTYGLAAGVHTKDLSTAITVADKLKAGTVWINQYNTLHHALPFGGYKESGIGRELGKAALANYTHIKTVSINLEGHASGW